MILTIFWKLTELTVRQNSCQFATQQPLHLSTNGCPIRIYEGEKLCADADTLIPQHR